ncbi:unnamed protein product [Lymnaea stagnalis]|uniref:Uncharacterized protein n=1 Tax=Lymnaea stagnalis TaxID=6523 RepID=A0AAV2I1V3_LYMST
MCRWGCPAFNSTFMCKWCGTRYCKECMRGEFAGNMKESAICAKCHQKRCQGQKVEGVLKEYMKNDENGGKGKKGLKSASSSRGKSPSQKGKKSGGGKKSGKSKGKTKSGKKGGKKKKKK